MNFPRQRPDFLGKKTEAQNVSFEVLPTLTSHPEIEVLEAEEVPSKKNLFSFEIKLSKIFLENGNQATDYKGIINDQTGSVLNISSNTYTPIYNNEFSDFIFEISERTGFEIGESIEIEGGRKLAAYLKLPPEAKERFNYQKYMIIGNSHDSSTGLFIGFSSMMVRCKNQFTPKMRGINIYHRQSAREKMILVENTIAGFMQSQNTTLKQFDIMLNTAMSYRPQDFAKLVLGVQKNEEISTRKENQIQLLESCIDTEIADLGKNNFALFNGVTRFTTHEIQSKTTVFGNWRGVKNELNNKALELCLA